MNKKLLPITFSILFIVSCGGGGGGGGSTPTPPSTPAPTVNLSAEPTSVLLESTSTLTWSSTNATSCSASWTSQTGTSGSEAVTITSAGNNSFSISCTGDGGSRSASVTIEGYRETDGVVVDGYISGAEVCIDEDESWTCDASENSTTSDNEGKFSIRYANGNLVSIGGTDLDSQTLLDNLLITHKLTGHSDFKAVTPVTSVAAFMEDASLVNAALGIDSSIDVFTFDPVANKGDGGINDYLYEKGNQLTVLAYALQNITNNINTTTETTQDYFKAITEEIEKEYTETETKVDIETEAFVTKALDNVITAKSVTIDETAKTNTTKALASILPVIEVKPSDDLTTGVIRFAVSTLQTDIQAIANGTATAETLTSYTSDVLAYIAEDQNINADEIAPDISAIADSASTSEDTAVTINVVANDSYLTSAPISVIAGNGTNGITSITESSPEQITYEPDADYNGTDTFSYTITQGDKTSSANVTVTIEAVNDAPSIDLASTIQVAENQTAVTTVSVSDVDEDELTLTLGGTDADSFNLSNENVLTFKEAPDYETKDSYSITLTLTDGTETVTKDINIVITNVNDISPIITSESTFSADENQKTIGLVTASDEDGDGITYAVSGSELTINPSSGALTFVLAPDYEAKTTYTAIITVSDGVFSATQDITININNLNDNSPVFASASTFSAAENQTAIGNVSATDADGDSVTFTVSGSELAITSAGVLTFASAPDYETKTSYTATVTASDGTNTTTQDITVNITNVNEAPSISSESNFTINENSTNISGLELIDVDSVLTPIINSTKTIGPSSVQPGPALWTTNCDDYCYSYESLVDKDFTTLGNEDGSTLVLTEDSTLSGGIYKIISDISLADGITLSCSGCTIFGEGETPLNYKKIQVKGGKLDGINAHFRKVQIGIEETDENNPGTIDLTYSTIIDSKFAYASGNAVYGNYVLQNNYFESVNVGDMFYIWYPRQLNILSNVFYNSGMLSIGFRSDDLDATGARIRHNVFDHNDTISYPGSTCCNYVPAYIRLWAAYGNTPLTLKNNVYLNENIYAFYDITGDNSSNITSTNEYFGLNASQASSRYLDDNDDVTVYTPVNVSSIKSSSLDTNLATFTPKLVFNSGNGSFNLDVPADYEAYQRSFSYKITYSDGETSGSKEVTLSINNLNDNKPEITSGSSFTVAENQTAVGTVTATDADGDSITFSVSGSELEITSAGVLTFASAPDYETKTSYTATVTASDGTNTTTQEVAISITNVNDIAPEITSNATFNVDENETSIGTITATDAEGDSVTFTVSGSELAITSAGVLTFASAPDYETKTSYTATVTASDGTNTTTQDITISINNLNDNSPSYTSSSSFSADENQTAIGNVSATDADGDSVTFTVSGSELAITSAGVLTFASAPDYETKTSYTATVTASDGTNTTTQDITISINNLNDNSPQFINRTANPNYTSEENNQGQFLGTLEASDADGNSFTFSIDDTDTFRIDSNNKLYFINGTDYESGNTIYTPTITVSDGVNSSSLQLNISITDVNEPPIFSSSSSFSVNENQNDITTISATDPEGADVTFGISGTDSGSLSINGTSGVLTFSSTPNYEVKSSYSLTVTARDASSNSSTLDLTININDVNDAPVATAAAYTMNLKPQSQTSGTLTLAGTDEDGDTLTYSIVSNGSYGTASLSGTTITYQTDASTQSAQSESFTFKVNDGTVDSSAATISIDLRTDPLYKYQWHLNNTGQTNFATNAGTSGADLNVDTVIASGISGDGVTVAIVDSGLELTHEDLADNIVANKSYDYNNDDNNPEPTGNDGDHGTSVAGIVAAVGWNNKGGRGVAPNASLVANNLTNFNASDTGRSDALGGAVSGYFDPTDVDIFNMSFGRNLGVTASGTTFDSVIASTYENGLINGVTNLRSGKGAIYINSSGNDWREAKDTNSDGDADTYYYCGPNYGAAAASDLFPCWDSSFDKVFATPYIIGVASLNANDTAAIYSTPGSSVWVSGYGGEYGSTNPAIMTVDESSCSKGYVLASGAGSGNNNSFNNGSHSENSACNYYSSFNGTSSAAPTVSGVVALMLEANPSLTWRDVKHILATTSTQIDASNSKSHLGVNQYSWITNAANYKHHNRYGFGKVNAAAAVSSAQTYSAGSLGTWVDTGFVESGTLNVAFNSFTRTTMNGDNDLVVAAPAGSSGIVEFVRIGIYMTHTSPNDVGIELQSPDGTTVPILPAFTRVTTNPNGSVFEIGVNSLYGENMAGTWTLIVTDYTDDSVGGTLNGWDIRIYGR